MRLLSPLLKQVVYPALRSTGYFRAAGSALPAVLTYHGVVSATYRIDDDIPDGPLLCSQDFREQVRTLKKNYNPISPGEFLAWLKHQEPLPPRAVLLSCDDGLLGHRTEMLPILLEENLSCLFFVPALCVEENPGMLWYVELSLLLLASEKSRCRFSFRGTMWDEPLGSPSQRRVTWLKLVERLSEHDARYRSSWLRQAETELGVVNVAERYLDDPASRNRFSLMSRRELRELADAGMAVGAHTISHPLLARQSADSAEYEIQESRRVLADTLGVPVWAMAYPFGYSGSATQREFNCAERGGYACAFLNFGGPVLTGSPLFALPRIHVTAEMQHSELEAHISGFYWKLRRTLRPA